MKHIPCLNSHISASQDVPILWILNFISIHSGSALVPILSQINPVPTVLTTSRSGHLLSDAPTNGHWTFLISPTCHVSRQSHAPSFNPTNNIQTSPLRPNLPSSLGVALPYGAKFHTHTKQQVKLYCKLLLLFALTYRPNNSHYLLLPVHSAEVSLRATARCRESEFLCQSYNFFCKLVHGLRHFKLSGSQRPASCTCSGSN